MEQPDRTLGLRKLDENAAEAFASRPSLWLQWLEAGLDAGGKTKRRFLVKNVYLNPVTFGSYRAVYTRNGFRSIDCPPLTGQGKNNADIYMVLDIVDALQSGFRYDEFVIASTDADFTPILHRLRGQDRRTTLLTAGLSAAAYRAVCDSFVSPEVLADVALGQFDDVEAVAEEESAPSIMMPPSSEARQVATEPKPSRTEEDMAAVRADVLGLGSGALGGVSERDSRRRRQSTTISHRGGVRALGLESAGVVQQAIGEIPDTDGSMIYTTNAIDSQSPLPVRRADTGPLPDRSKKKSTMDDTVEASTQRIRHHRPPTAKGLGGSGA